MQWPVGPECKLARCRGTNGKRSTDMSIGRDGTRYACTHMYMYILVCIVGEVQHNDDLDEHIGVETLT